MKALLAALFVVAAPSFAADLKDLGIETEAGVESKKSLAKPSLKPAFKLDAAAEEKPNRKRPAIEDVDKDESKDTGSKKFKRSQLKPVRQPLLKPVKAVKGGQDESKATSY